MTTNISQDVTCDVERPELDSDQCCLKQQLSQVLKTSLHDLSSENVWIRAHSQSIPAPGECEQVSNFGPRTVQGLPGSYGLHWTVQLTHCLYRKKLCLSIADLQGSLGLPLTGNVLHGYGPNSSKVQGFAEPCWYAQNCLHHIPSTTDA